MRTTHRTTKQARGQVFTDEGGVGSGLRQVSKKVDILAPPDCIYLYIVKNRLSSSMRITFHAEA